MVGFEDGHAVVPWGGGRRGGDGLGGRGTGTGTEPLGLGAAARGLLGGLGAAVGIGERRGDGVDDVQDAVQVQIQSGGDAAVAGEVDGLDVVPLGVQDVDAGVADGHVAGLGFAAEEEDHGHGAAREVDAAVVAQGDVQVAALVGAAEGFGLEDETRQGLTVGRQLVDAGLEADLVGALIQVQAVGQHVGVAVEADVQALEGPADLLGVVGAAEVGHGHDPEGRPIRRQGMQGLMPVVQHVDRSVGRRADIGDATIMPGPEGPGLFLPGVDQLVAVGRRRGGLLVGRGDGGRGGRPHEEGRR